MLHIDLEQARGLVDLVGQENAERLGLAVLSGVGLSCLWTGGRLAWRGATLAARLGLAGGRLALAGARAGCARLTPRHSGLVDALLAALNDPDAVVSAGLLKTRRLVVDVAGGKLLIAGQQDVSGLLTPRERSLVLGRAKAVQAAVEARGVEEMRQVAAMELAD